MGDTNPRSGKAVGTCINTGEQPTTAARVLLVGQQSQPRDRRPCPLHEAYAVHAASQTQSEDRSAKAALGPFQASTMNHIRILKRGPLCMQKGKVEYGADSKRDLKKGYTSTLPVTFYFLRFSSVLFQLSPNYLHAALHGCGLPGLRQALASRLTVF